MLAGLSGHVRPVEGEAEEVNKTVPVKPSMGETVIVETVVTPASAFTLVGFALTE